ncbi:MAG: L-threonylcarbamoyladenylate synthase [Bacteroidales bacterium]|jgi:L-threonylcarbamoyladenylate synthase|nr:L-threonylcarbamoyladenylate synthase [Bacteroidales bacterium]
MELKKAVDEAVKVLRSGGVILYPTDTVWGLGCDASNASAVEKLCKIKRRKKCSGLIVLASDMNMVCRHVKKVSEIAEQITEVSVNPLTVIYPGAFNLAHNVIADDGTIAIRIPDHPFCNLLLARFGRPVVATSANISGLETPRHYEDIEDDIISAADWVADPFHEEGSTGKPSSIIFLGEGGEVKVIRD